MRNRSGVNIVYRESAKLFVSSKILSGLGSVASQEIGELLNTWVQRPGQAWSVIFTASQHGYQVSNCDHNIIGRGDMAIGQALDYLSRGKGI